MKKVNCLQSIKTLMLFLILIFFLVFFNKAKAQFSGTVYVLGNQVTADTCNKAKGSFSVVLTPGSNSYSSLFVTNQNGIQIQPSFSDPSLFENLPAGTYNIYPFPLDFSDFSITSTINIDLVDPLQSGSLVTLPTCTVNGIITLNPSNGLAPYSYLWDNFSTNSSITLSIGNYSKNVRITDVTGCILDEQFVINTLSSVSLNPQVIQPTCSVNGSIILNATGAAPYTYLWSNNATTPTLNPSAGTYSLSVIVTGNDGCTKTESFNIQTNQNPNVVISSCDNYVYNDITYSQTSIVAENFSQNGCVENRRTHINIYPANTHQLNSTNSLFNCIDSSLLSISSNNNLHIQSINWFKNGASIGNTQTNSLTTVAGGNGLGNALNQFNNHPRAVDFDNQGNMYVADFGNHRVLKFPPNSTSLTNGVVIAGGNGSGNGLNQLGQPDGIFIKGNFLYVADNGNDRIMKYNINSTTSNGVGVIAVKEGLRYVRDVFVTQNDEIYVSEELYQRVTKFPANSNEFTPGVVVAGSSVGTASNAPNSAGTFGAALNQLSYPNAIWVQPNGDLYITDFYNQRVMKWAVGATTGVVAAGGNFGGSSLSQLNYPSDVIFDASGNMYVSDGLFGGTIMESRIIYFPPNSTQSSYGCTLINNLQSINRFAFDSHGDLYFSEPANYRVVKLNKLLSKMVYQTGTYTAEVIMDNGCIYNVGPISITSQVIAIRDTINITNNNCFSVTYNNQIYYSNTTLYDTIKTVVGACDSIYRVTNLTIKQPSTSTTNITICTSALPYTWNGFSYNAAGTYTVTLTNAAGCDSIATLNLATNVCCVATYSTTNESFCFTKNPFSWNGSNYYTSGTYTVKLVNANGCDSLATLNLVVGTPTSSTTIETACDSYTWNGNTYTTSGTYNFNTTNSNGCDSTATLFITINASPIVTLTTASSPCFNPKILSLAGVPVGATVQWLLNNQTFNTTGTSNTGISTLASSLNGPVHIAKDAAENIYVADYNNDRIIKIAATTNIITVVAGGNGRGNAANQLNQPSGVSLDGNDLIIADHWNHRIVRWTIGATSGATIAGNGFANTTAHQLNYPLNAIVDASGNLYVADRSNHRIQKFAPGATNGVTVAGGNGQGTALNQLNLPNDIDLDINGDLIISDRLNARILRWKLGDANGTVEAATGLSQPLAVYIAPNGTKYITDVVNNTVTKWNVGATTGTIVVGNAQSILNYPSGVTIANDGCVVVSQYNDNSVKKYCGATSSISTTIAGTYTATITANGCTTTAGPLVITMPSTVTNVYNYDSCNAVTINGVTYTSSTTFNTTIQDINGCDSVINQYYINVTPIEDKIEIVNVEGCGSVTYNGNVYTISTNFYDTISFDKPKCVRYINDVNITINPWGNIYDTVNIEGCGAVTHNGVVYTASISKNDTTIADCARYIHTLNITVTPWVIEEETTTYTGCGSVRVGDIIYTSDTTLYDTITKPTGCVKNVYITIIDIRAYQYNVITTNLSGCGSVLYNGITYTSSTILSDTVNVSTDTICKKNVNTVNINITPWTVLNDTTRLNGCSSITYKDNVYTASTTLNSTSQNTATCTKTNTTVIITVTPWTIFNDTTRLNGCDSVIFNTVIYRNNDTIRTTNVREDSCLSRNRVVIITVNPSPVFTLTNASGVCDRPQNISVNVNGGTNGQTITWTFNGNSFNPTITNSLAATTVAGGNNSGSNANQFNSCLGLLLDAQGRIYVSDYLNHRVQRFPANSTSATNGITYAGGNGLGINLNQFDRLAGMCFDAAGNLYVADYYNARVLRFPPNSTSTTQGVIVAQENLGYVNDVFVDNLNRIYVVDHLSNRVTRFPANSDENTTGVVVAGLSTGNTANNLNNPVSVFVDANYNVIVADKLQHRVVSYPSNYTTTQTTAVPVLAGTGTAGSGVTELNMPVDVMFDPQGRMYVTEEAGNRIIRFPANSTSGTAGTVVYGNNGTTLSAPYHMAQDALGRIYIAEGGNFRVIRLDSTQTVQVNQTGTYTVTVTNQFGCSSTKTIVVSMPPVVVRDTARLTGCGKVTNPITNTGYTTSTILRDTSRTANGCDSLIKVTTITITPLAITTIDTVRISGCGQVNHNNVIYNTNTILRDTTFVKDSCKASISVTIITANVGLSLTLNNISNICSKPQILTVNGTSTNTNSISKIDWYRDGVLVETSLRGRFFGQGRTVAGVTGISGSATTHLNDPHGVFVIGNDMYITDWNNHRVLRWTIGATSGAVVAGGNGAGNAANQLAFPSNAFVKSNRDVYITDYGNSRIQLWANGVTTGVTAVSGLSSPRGMFVKSNGDIIVANSQANEIRNGAITTHTNVGSNIANICEDAAGNMYVADQANNRILKYAPNSTIATVAASLSLPNGSLNAPWGVYVDYLNQLYVTENGSHKLVKFPANSNATTLPNFSIGTGIAGTANNQFNIPNGVFVDNLGRIFIADGNNHRIQMFDTSVELSHTTNLSGSFTAVVTDINGCVTYLGALDVHIPPVVKNDTTFITTAACSYQYKGKKYTSSTIFIEDTIRTNFGCDSLINYVSIVLAGRSDTRDTIRLTSCGSLYYNGITYDSSIVIRDTISITDTCKMHIKVTEITINQQQRDTIRLNGCRSVTYNGRAYTNSVVIRDTISAIGDCITNLKVIEITVTPSPIPVITTIGSVCSNPKLVGVSPTIPYDYITWKRYGTTIASGANSTNVTITVEATYSVEVKYSNGCVATTSQYITLMPTPINVYIDTSACGAFMFNGIQINKDTIILKDTLRNSSGCVTQVRYNKLKVNPAFVVPTLSINNVCEPTLVLKNVEKNATIRWFKDGVAVVTPPIYKQQGVTVFGNGAVGAGAISLADATGLVIDKHDNLFLADDRNNRILKYSLASNTLLATITGVNRPLGIFVDDNDTLYSYNKPTQVVRFNSSYTTTTPVANIYNNISYGITKDQYNNVYANAWFDHYINQYKPNNYAGANFFSGIYEPFALVAKGISLHAVDHYYNRVYTKNILTGSSSYFTTAAAPSGCYVDDYQNMFIVTQVDGAVRYKQKNSSTQYLMVGNNGIGNAANQLNAPFAIAFDSKKNMYISDDYNHRVQRFDFVANYDTALRVTTNGVYTVRIENEYGCGITLGPINVSIPTAIKDTTTIIACGTKVTYFGKTYTTNTYINLDTVKSIAGCDSIIHIGYLKLTSNLTPSLSILVRGSDRVCKGSNLSIKAFPVNGGTNPQYQWTVNGVPVTGANDVYFISNSLNNGDTIRCILTSNYPCVTSNDIVSNYIIARVATQTFKQVNISGCNSVTVNNITYQNSTIVSDTVRNNIGCDSIITTTNITINQLIAQTTTNNILGCNSVVYNGVTYVNSTTLKDTLRSTQGCDSLYRINNIVVTKVVAVNNVTNLPGCGSVSIGDKKYITSIVLRDTTKSVLGCDSIYNITNITINPIVIPTIVITPSQNPVCIYTNIIYTSTITNGGTNPQYQWYKNGVLIPGATSATYINAGLPDSTTVYTCTLTSNAPCAEPRTVLSNSLRLTFGSVAIATISISANQATICSTATVIFTATAINGGTAPQYQWKKNGVNISGANSATYSTANIANNDVFTCALTSNSPCVSTANVLSNGIAITVNASSVTDIYNDGSIIAPAYIPLYVPTTVSTTQPIGGIWKISNRILISNSPASTISVTVSGIPTGANNLIYQLTNQATKCTTNYIKSLIIISSSTPPVTQNITLCSLGLTRTLTSNYSSAGTWVSNDPSVVSLVSTSSTATTSSVLIKSNTAGTAAVSYNVQIASGVFYTESTIVTVAPVTVAPIIGNTSICIGATTQLANATPSGVWSSVAGRATTNAIGLVTGTSAGIAEIRYTVNNATTGCSAYAVKNVTVNATPNMPTIAYAPTTINPQIGAGGGNNFCINKTFDVVGTPVGGVWTSSNLGVMTVTNLGTVKTVGLGSASLNYRFAINGCSNSRYMNGTVVSCAAKGVSINNQQLVASNDFEIYPNPAKSILNLNVETLIGKGSIIVTDLYGKTLKIQALSMGTNTVDIANLSKGMYFVSTITNEGKTTKKLVVE